MFSLEGGRAGKIAAANRQRKEASEQGKDAHEVRRTMIRLSIRGADVAGAATFLGNLDGRQFAPSQRAMISIRNVNAVLLGMSSRISSLVISILRAYRLERTCPSSSFLRERMPGARQNHYGWRLVFRLLPGTPLSSIRDPRSTIHHALCKSAQLDAFPQFFPIAHCAGGRFLEKRLAQLGKKP